MSYNIGCAGSSPGYAGCIDPEGYLYKDLAVSQNSAWGYRTKITIDHTKVSTIDQLSFPVLISRTDVDWKDVTNGGTVGQSDGGDIKFMASDGTTKLAHEIEKYVPSTGELIVWVKVPVVSASVDTEIYMYWGNPNVIDQWNVAGVWDSNFKGVWHLPNGTTLSTNDSTSNANNGINNGVTATTGIIGGSSNFS